MSSSLSESISLQQLTVGELNNVKSFNANKAPGHDNISMKIIHQSFQNIAQPLETIINIYSLSAGVFPESLKIAKVIPVFKADDPTLFSNYRPISIILPAFSKLFEKVMYNRLINFLNLHIVCDPPRDNRDKGDDTLTTR